MIKRISLVRRKEGMSREEFLAHWMGPHAEIVRQLHQAEGLENPCGDQREGANGGISRFLS